MLTNDKTVDLANVATRITGGMSVLLGFAVLAGWYTGSPALIKISHAFPAMQFNTALGFLLCGTGLISISFKRPHITTICGGMVSFIGLLTLIQYLFNIDIGIDRLLMRDYISPGISHPGRMAPNTALNFSLAGWSMLLMGRKSRAEYRPPALVFAGSIIAAVSIFAFAGYLLGIKTAYIWGYNIIGMAVHTAIGFVFIGAGIIVFAWLDDASKKRAGQSWFPVFTGTFFLTATLFTHQALIYQERAHIERTIQAVAEGLKHEIKERMESRVNALVRMAERWKIGGGTPEAQWKHDVELYLEHLPGYKAIELVKPLAAQKVQPMTFYIEGDRLRIYVPIGQGNEDKGYIAGTFSIKAFFDDIFREATDENYSVKVSGPGKEIYANNLTGAGNEDWSYRTGIGFYNIAWDLAVGPNAKKLESMITPMPKVAVGIGLILFLLLTISIYFAQKSNRQLKVLAEQARQLQQSNEELEMFAYVASHDLQEPLRTISSFSQLLTRRYKDKLDSDAEEFISFIVDGASRMQRLINDLLTYSRVGTRGRDFVPVDCEVVLNSVLANLQEAVDETGAAVSRAPLPLIMADPTQFEQLLQNLISNAIKFCHDGTPRVHISAEKDRSEWIFSIRDNGIGIAPDNFDRIFVMFQRLHGRNEYSGTGIGLAVCKKVVERHGGRIWVKSQERKGSTFCFSIPDRCDKSFHPPHIRQK